MIVWGFSGVVLLAIAGWALTTQPLLGPVDPIAVKEVSAQRLEQHVRRIVGCQPRDFEHPETLDRVAAYIRGELTAAGARVADQEFQVEGRTCRNVIGEFGPDQGERIVVGAHYDVDPGTPGADDNASAVAGLIELAYALGRSPPPLRVELVAYTLEEPPNFATPNMGSAVHARRLSDDGAAVRAMLCLEIIGDTAFFRNPNYHRATDTPETLDYDRMAAVVQGVLGAIEVLAR